MFLEIYLIFFPYIYYYNITLLLRTFFNKKQIYKNIMSKKILLKRSNQKESNGQPKLPLPSQMDYGELAINYAKDAETLSIKNSDNKIVTFNKINIIQTSGSSASNVMSQDAVTTELNKKADKATTLAGYGIIDAKIEDGSITIGKETIKPLTSVPTEYVTDDELSAKGYQTASQVSSAISSLVDSAPETLNTLNELAAALGDDPNFATTITNQIARKADASVLDNYATKTALTSGLAGKADTSHSHKAYQISGLDALKALISDGSGVITPSAITSTELEYLDGVTSNIQTQLDNKAPSNHTHTIADIKGLDGATLNNMILYYKFIHSAQNQKSGSTLTITVNNFKHLYQWNLPDVSTEFLITLPEGWFSSNNTVTANYYGWDIVIMINNPNTSAKTISFNSDNSDIDNNLIGVSHTFTVESKAQMYITLRFGKGVMFVEYNNQKKQL